MRARAHLALRRVSLLLGLAALGALIVLQAVRPERRGSFVGRTGGTYRLRILTWNVGRIFLPVEPLATDSRLSDEDLVHIAQVVREHDPDVVALQELKGRDQLERLSMLLGGEYEGRVPEEETHDRVVAVMARRALAGSRGFVFRSITTSTGRGAVAVSFSVGDSVRALVVSIHLDAFDRHLRRVQAEEIVDWASRQPEPDIFLCGDFNLDSEFLARHGEEHPDLQTYRILTGRFEDLGRAAGRTTVLSRRVDYIFARTSGVEARDVRVLPGKRRTLMDHDPVVGTFEVTKRHGGFHRSPAPGRGEKTAGSTEPVKPAGAAKPSSGPDGSASSDGAGPGTPSPPAPVRTSADTQPRSDGEGSGGRAEKGGAPRAPVRDGR